MSSLTLIIEVLTYGFIEIWSTLWERWENGTCAICTKSVFRCLFCFSCIFFAAIIFLAVPLSLSSYFLCFICLLSIVANVYCFLCSCLHRIVSSTQHHRLLFSTLCYLTYCYSVIPCPQFFFPVFVCCHLVA